MVVVPQKLKRALNRKLRTGWYSVARPQFGLML